LVGDEQIEQDAPQTDRPADAARLGGRRRSRELALQVLYQLDMTGEQDWRTAFDLFCGSFEAPEPLKDFAMRLVEGVRANMERIDVLMREHSENWRLERMSRVDRNILRMAVFELLYCEDIPPRVTLNEAVDLGKRYGTEESGAFINGVLDNIYKATRGAGENEPAVDVGPGEPEGPQG
jgi:N utilization substance protein B